LPFLIMPLILFYGGVGNFIAGIMQYINKDTWGATTFITVACSFFQLGYIFVPSSGVLTAYANSPEEFDNALGFVLLSFTIVILIITASSLKTTVFTTASLGTLTVMFVLFTAGRLTHNSDILKAAGWIGIVVAFEVYYAALA
ncbi:GPR1/FUN34/yaaH family-domain-containing protein, partial [Zopfochytrium polystomum]